MLVWRQPQREQRRHYKDRGADRILQLEGGAEELERHAGIPQADDERGGCHDQHDQRQVHEAADAQRLARVRIAVARLATEEPKIHDEEHREHQHRDEAGLHPQIPQRPQKIDAMEEADEQWRVAQGAERATDVGDQDDEEHDHMRIAGAGLVGAQQRPDEDHGGAGGADDAGYRRADREETRVDQRRAGETSGHQDAACYRVKREQHDDETQVLGQQRMNECIDGRHGAELRRDREQRDRRPAGGDLTVVVMPDAAEQQRPGRDREQHADEG
jgi:hypothetical protein